MLYLITFGILIGFLLYYLGSQLVQKKPEVIKNTVRFGGVIAFIIFLLRIGPLAVYNLVQMIFMLLPLINKYSNSNENLYTDKQSESHMTIDEARQILGVGEQATKEEIKLAFKRLIKKNHPDQGGSQYIAKKLIQAKDILLK